MTTNSNADGVICRDKHLPVTLPRGAKNPICEISCPKHHSLNGFRDQSP